MIARLCRLLAVWTLENSLTSLLRIGNNNISLIGALGRINDMRRCSPRTGRVGVGDRV